MKRADACLASGQRGALEAMLAVGLVGVAALLTAVTGCSSSSSNPGAPDGSAMTPAGESDAGGDSSSALCAAAGGQCLGFGATCTTIVGPVHACESDMPGGSFCCAVGPDAGRCTPKASNYDQSCKVDNDCVAVHAGDSCSLCALNCTNTAISVSAQAQYMSDLLNTPAAISAQRSACTGDCTFQFGPCCIGGTCQMGGQCPGPPVSCALGAACSSTEVCTGGIAGCTTNCQCLRGKWQAPCPIDLPVTGSACTAAGAYCGYSDQPNPCGASNCYCQSGAWTCEPTCAIPIEDAAAAADTGADAAAEAGPADAGAE